MNALPESTSLRQMVDRAARALILLSLAVVLAPVQGQNDVQVDLRELNGLSADLVARAQSGKADATRFRIDATLYRESLRRVMLRESPEPAPRALLLDMVRMAALLNAAAECKTGRYITCPAALMRQLIAQQARLDTSLSELPAGSAG